MPRYELFCPDEQCTKHEREIIICRISEYDEQKICPVCGAIRVACIPEKPIPFTIHGIKWS